MPFTESWDDFLSTSEFATAGTIDGTAVNVILENKWVELTLGGAPYSGTRPTIMCKSTDVSGKLDTTAVFNSTNYTIIDIQPDGTGMSMCVLMEQ